MLKSVKDFDEACEIIHGTRRVLSHGGFNLTKFVTNDLVLPKQIDEKTEQQKSNKSSQTCTSKHWVFSGKSVVTAFITVIKVLNVHLLTDATCWAEQCPCMIRWGWLHQLYFKANYCFKRPRASSWNGMSQCRTAYMINGVHGYSNWKRLLSYDFNQFNRSQYRDSSCARW